MSKKQKKTVGQAIKWWWTTRILGYWRIKVGGKIKQQLTAKPDVITFNKDATQMPEPSKGDITVILTAYRRSQYLPDQIKALRAQTIPPKEIWVWSNRSQDDLVDVSELADRVVVSNSNFLFWGRFALANLARTEYVAFFDDDILPQPKWFESCLKTIKDGFDGILGGSGVILPKEGGYSSKHKAGWNGKQLSFPTQVDLVGHSWFMRKEYVNYMWREEPHSWDNGEDIHLSYMALKYGGIKTYVPPHPTNTPDVWSCRPDFGKVVGRLKVATYQTSGHKNTRSEIVDAYRNNGWGIVETQPGYVSPTERSFPNALNEINEKINARENFSLVRFGDGEMAVINGQAIDYSNKDNGEHKYTPNNDTDEKYRKILEESLLYRSDNYYVGLPCRCCVGDQHCDNLRNQSQQPDKQLTWANIFVNSNYPAFLEGTVQAMQGSKVNIICHEKANISKLPFEVIKDFRIGKNAWTNDYEQTLSAIQQYIESNAIENQVFIFCAGVLSNMVIYQLSKQFPNNTYLDVGSVFDDIMELGQTRKYLKGSKKRLNKVCVW